MRLSRSLATHAVNAGRTSFVIRHNWAKEEIQMIYDSSLMDLVFHASSVHRQFHDPKKIQLCTLMNIKSTYVALSFLLWSLILTLPGVLLAGGCSEDCRAIHCYVSS